MMNNDKKTRWFQDAVWYNRRFHVTKKFDVVEGGSKRSVVRRGLHDMGEDGRDGHDERVEGLHAPGTF